MSSMLNHPDVSAHVISRHIGRLHVSVSSIYCELVQGDGPFRMGKPVIHKDLP